MNLKKIIQWYTSIEALSYLTTMIFGAALGFGLSTVLLIKSQNISDLIVILLKMTFLLIIIGVIFRLTTFTFYRKNSEGIPEDWIAMIKKNIADISPRFTMKRMFDEYNSKYYQPQIKRYRELAEKDFSKMKDLVAWKKRFTEKWSSFDIVHIDYPDSNAIPMKLGDEFTARVLLRLGDCDPSDVGVEIVFGNKENQQIKAVSEVQELKMTKFQDGVAQYEMQLPFSRAGVFNFGFRVFPKHPLLPHRQDFPLIKWI